ncbi:hypothetical protein KP509_14G092900 [Ceratopteris richardii]|nr:hypothetical protein KP509_14G092900 [Ceratopteris richardii]
MDDEACSKSSVEDVLECPVCWEGFNSGSQLPYVLWCGHSLCKSCLLGLQWATVKLPILPVQLPLLIACPWCQFLSCRLVWRGKLKYPSKNFFLLWLVESVRTGPRHLGDTSKPETLQPDVHYETAHQVPSFSLRQLARPQLNADTQILQRWMRKLGGLCALLMAKVMLMLLVMFILFCVLPFSTIVLMVYFVATLIFAFPSFLVVYFAFPSLNWLLREIIT